MPYRRNLSALFFALSSYSDNTKILRFGQVANFTIIKVKTVQKNTGQSPEKANWPVKIFNPPPA
jgi:hypothetical protein